MINFLDSYIDRLTPKVKSAGAVACMYAERVIARLDLLVDAVQSEEFAEYHPRQSFTLLAGAAQDMTQIPATEMWELEFLACSGNGAVVTINEGADLFRYTKLFTNADVSIAIGLVFGGGTAPTIIASANTQVVVQFKRRRVRPAKRTNAPGLVESVDLLNGQPYGEISPQVEHRHDNHAVQMPNVIGARKGDGLTQQ